MYLNKTYLLGNLIKDPEMKAMPNGGKVTTFSLATNRVYKDANGNRQEDTQFHNIVVFGRQAETSAEYLKKGQQVLIEGRIQTRSWDDAQGVKKYRTEIVADAVQFGAKGQGGSSSGAPATKDSNDNSAIPQGSGSNLDSIDYGDVIDTEDIPF